MVPRHQTQIVLVSEAGPGYTSHVLLRAVLISRTSVNCMRMVDSDTVRLVCESRLHRTCVDTIVFAAIPH